jgi:tryptophanyl-tRNA synthetase
LYHFPAAGHIELAREIARRFNHLYRPIFPEPETMLTTSPKILGTDGRKMSKSYQNAVYLTEPPEDVAAKLSRMVTDPRRARRHDPGEPADCPVYTSLHRIYSTPAELAWQEQGCRTAGIGCLECKQVTIRHVLAELETIRTRREGLRADDARDALTTGNRRASEVARRTMGEVREAMGL